jgi:hypothetical protein
VHDPFAGPGVRLGQLADEMGWRFTGTEIEWEFIIDPRVKGGDATDRRRYPREQYTVMTSPAYPNGMSDDFHARDSSTRRTYRAALAKILGHDRQLHANNQGRWGYRGTPLHSPARAQYWRIADQVATQWQLTPCSDVFLNVSDFVVGKVDVEPVVAPWARTLEAHGFAIIRAYPVLSRRWRNGANRDSRVANEVVLHATRATWEE